ncbi:MAG: hypothetical protein ND807_05895 [Vicinamibacterales bacterium]|nr:hypothetical protein [Vicinamibacterales bacterium]
MTIGVSRRAAVVLAIMLAGIGATAEAQERYALVVAGVAGGEKFAENHKKWTASLESLLTKRLAFAPDHVTILSESASPASAATRENVTRALASFTQRVKADDTLVIFLIGHGTADSTTAKFNLVGPDMEAKEWKAALEGLAGRLVFVDTTSSSFPFVQAMAGKNRVVIAATDSASQRYDTVFPEYFIEALTQSTNADADKNGRLSVWEAFVYASQAVKAAFEQKGTLVTERSVIDDNGDGVAKEATAATGSDGVLAKTTFLDAEPASTAANAAVAGLERQRVALEARIEELKGRKDQMPAGQYEEEFEKLAVELAQVSAKIRSAK